MSAWGRTVAKSALENYGRHHAWCALLKDSLGTCDCGFSKTLDEIGRRRCAKCEGVLAELPVTGGFCMDCGNQPDTPAADSRDTEAERFDDALTRYLRQGYLDTMDDPLDEYGKRIVRRLQTLYRASVPEGTNG